MGFHILFLFKFALFVDWKIVVFVHKIKKRKKKFKFALFVDRKIVVCIKLKKRNCSLYFVTGRFLYVGNCHL